MMDVYAAIHRALLPNSKRGKTIIRQEAKSIVDVVRADGQVTKEEIGTLKALVRDTDVFRVTRAAEREFQKLIDAGPTSISPQTPV